MRIVKRNKVSKKKIGKVVFYNHDLEKHELDTIFCLANFGFDIEVLAPSNIPKSKNPNLLMLGTYWEMKGPGTSNEDTVKFHFRKAKKQSNGKAVFDIRRVRKDKEKIKNYIIELFRDTREMRRVMIIIDDENILDLLK